MTGQKPQHIMLQLLRRCSQIFIVAVIIALPFFSLYEHYRAANAIDDIQLMSGLRGKVLALIDNRFSLTDDPQVILENFKGTLWSMRFAGIEISDPLAVAEMTASSGTVYIPFILSAVIPVMLTLILGRIFCSWICPANLMFEIANKLRSILKFAEIQTPEIEFSLNNKYLILGTGLIVASIVSQPLLSFIYPPAVLSRMTHAVIFGTASAGMIILMLLLAGIEVFISPRWWCRTMCPGAALYALIGWPRLLRVRIAEHRCNKCGKCEKVCEPGINPVADSDGIECTNCGKCIKVCTESALKFSVGLPPIKRNLRTHVKKLSNVVLFSGIAVMLFLALPPPACCHHILGLPHYSYKENYPQAPTLEYPASSGPYDVLLTSYPGKPVPKEAASLSFYIKNRITGEPYDKPISIRVLETFTFGRSSVVLKPTVCEPFERPYKLYVTFPDDGEYVVELMMDVEGRSEVIPFLLIAGEPSAATSVLITAGVLLILFIITVRAIKIKRARHTAGA